MMHRSAPIHHSLQAGRRAQLLSELIHKRLPVEPGFVVTAQAFDAFVEHNDLKEKINTVLRQGSHDTLASLRPISREIQKIIRHGEFPEDIQRQILSTYVGLGQPKVMLFPSVFVKDKENPLFAHVEGYYFGYKGDANLFEAIKEIWSHFFDPKPLYYRLKERKDHFSLPFAISIQTQSAYKVTGVLYTNDPTSTTKQTALVKAVYGEGGLIGDLEGADYYWIKRGSGDVYNSMFDAQKDQIALSHGKEQLLGVPKTLQEKRKLSDANLEKIGKLSQAIQQHFFFPQQCIFAYTGKDIVLIEVQPFYGNSTLRTPLPQSPAPTPPAHVSPPALVKPSDEQHQTPPAVRLGLWHFLTQAGHLPITSTIDGHIFLSATHILTNYEDELSSGKKKALAHEISTALSFTAQHCHALSGFIYDFGESLEDLAHAQAQVDGIRNARSSFPLLQLMLVSRSKRTDELARFISFWRTNELPRSSKISYAVVISVPAQIHSIAEYVALGIDAVLVDIDAISSALHGGEQLHHDGSSVATGEHLARIGQLCVAHGIQCIVFSAKSPSHAMLMNTQAHSIAEWIVPSTAYIEMKKDR